METEFEALYLEMRQLVFAFAARVMAPQEAMDVVSETFEVVWRKWADAPASSDARRAWCWGIAKNKVRQSTQRRWRKHHDSRFVADHPGVRHPITQDPADTVTAQLTGRDVLASLTESELELLQAVTSTNLPGAEIAAMLGASYTSYTSRVSRLRKKIGRQLDSPPEFEGEVSRA